MREIPAQRLKSVSSKVVLTQRKYTDRDGIQRTAVDVIASDMEILTPKSATVGAGSYAGNTSSDSDDPFLPDFPDDVS